MGFEVCCPPPSSFGAQNWSKFVFSRFFGNRKFAEKSPPQKSIFFRDFVDFLVLACRFFVDFGGLGPPPGLILCAFLGYAFFGCFFGQFWPKVEKMEKVKCAQNTSPANRFEDLAVREKPTESWKNASKKSSGNHRKSTKI